MRHLTPDPILLEPSEAAEGLPVDAAESTWDPILWTLYLREIAREHPPAVH